MYFISCEKFTEAHLVHCIALFQKSKEITSYQKFHEKKYNENFNHS